MAHNRGGIGSSPKSTQESDAEFEACYDYGLAHPGDANPGAGAPAILIEASRLKITDMTIAEWSETDMQWWHEMAQAISAWRNGQIAGGEVEQARKEISRT